jgi:hypothetical protein
MARKEHVELVDDLDNGPADETVSFGLSGKQYSIDLSAKHATELRAVFGKYIAVARLEAKTSAAARQGRAGKKREESTAGDVRDWAKSQGIAVSDRGRIPTDLMVKFQAAQIS